MAPTWMYPGNCARSWKTIWIGGLQIGASYDMAMWVFGHEQVAIVMALREMTVIFAR